MTVEDAVEFLKQNAHRSKTLSTWDERTMLYWIDHGIRSGSFVYHIDETTNELTGITLCRKDPVGKVMYVIMCVAETREAFTGMIDYFVRVFPEWKLIGRRHGKLKIFNTKKLWVKHQYQQ